MDREILHQPSWAQTAMGTPIEIYRSATGSGRPILFVGGVHGDEPEGVRLATDLLIWLQKNNNSVSRSWLLIPCLNVDGYKKNVRTNSNGVDLNRNFATSDWSPTAKAPRYYPGMIPNSEKETQALSHLIQFEKPSLIIHFHSWEPCIVYTGEEGAGPAALLAQDTPYEAKEDIGYPTPGSLGQYGWLNHRIPVICIEAQEKSDPNTIWPIFGPGLQKLLRAE